MPSRNDDNDDFDKITGDMLKKQAQKPTTWDLPPNQVSRADIETFKANPDLDTYQLLATRTAIYPGKAYPLGMMYVSLKLNGEAGEVADHVGKALSTDGFGSTVTQLSHDRRQLVIKEGGDVLWYLAALCNELGIPMSEMAGVNLDKLADRAERKMIRGSGDER